MGGRRRLPASSEWCRGELNTRAAWPGTVSVSATGRLRTPYGGVTVAKTLPEVPTSLCCLGGYVTPICLRAVPVSTVYCLYFTCPFL